MLSRYQRMVFSIPHGMIIGLSVQHQPEIVYVAQNTPASEAGFQEGDIIIGFERNKGKNLPSITNMINTLKGEAREVEIEVLRSGKRLSLTLKLRELFAAVEQSNP